jgi:DNA polymerase-3 subunit epsilon
MRPDPREVAAALAPAALLALALAAAAALLLATAEPAERATLIELAAPRMALVVMLWFFLSLAGGVLARWVWQHYAAAPGRLAEQLQIELARGGARDLPSTAASPTPPAEGSPGARALAAAVQALVQQRDGLRADIAARVAEASREVEQERNRLAALMAELTQSVVVCNLDGRILLFNARARLQFRALVAVPAGGPATVQATGQAIGGAEAIGLGRSIYAVLDRRLVAHAIEAVQQRLQRGAASPSAQFVTATASGQLLRVQMAPVRTPGAGADDALAGFVLMLDNITRDMAEEGERDRLVHSLTEGSRGALGNLQAAVELLDDPTLDVTTRERFLAVIREEIAGMSRRLNEAAAQGARALKTRWPLEDMRGADLVAAAVLRIEAVHGCRATAAEVDASLWLRVDSYSLIQALLHLTGRLVDETGLQRVRIRLQPSGERAQLDLVWAGQAMSTETVMAWETEPLKVGSDTSALTVRDVVERHGGAFWFERERVRQEAFFRFLLPLAAENVPLEAGAVTSQPSRPEFYDFDLFAQGSQGAALAERSLADLAYTVFDTETTGLQPSQGDEIIQIGATRIVAGKLRRQECFEQLVDPQRSVPEAGVAIHGIQAQMLRGQPTIAVVLPAFHTFAHDSVLLAHNAAFDMRFLQLKEESTGVRFEQPVLDTLLLSAVVHPQQESHSLEAMCERLGVSVLGRHTALGDAMVTAEVFLKMLPLLQAQGIATLGQALEASRKTYLARVSY